MNESINNPRDGSLIWRVNHVTWDGAGGGGRLTRTGGKTDTRGGGEGPVSE